MHAFALMQIMIGEREKSKGKDIMNTYICVYPLLGIMLCSLSLPPSLSLVSFLFILPLGKTTNLREFFSKYVCVAVFLSF